MVHQDSDLLSDDGLQPAKKKAKPRAQVRRALVQAAALTHASLYLNNLTLTLVMLPSDVRGWWKQQFETTQGHGTRRTRGQETTRQGKAQAEGERQGMGLVGGLTVVVYMCGCGY